MEESDEAIVAATRGIAFMLLADAFAGLAEGVIALDPERGHQLLHEMEKRVASRLRRFTVENPGLSRPDILYAAASEVRSVLKAAQGEADD